jgi:hypothetical protein
MPHVVSAAIYFPSGGGLIGQSGESVRAVCINAVNFCTTSGCFAARSLLSAGSVFRSYNSTGLLIAG